MIYGFEPRLIFAVVFVAAVAAFLWYDRKKIQRVSILFYRRTQHGVEFIDRMAGRFPRFWKVYGWTGVAFGLVSIPAALYLVSVSLFQLFRSPSVGGGPALIAPGLGSEATFQSGVSFIPIEYWLISIMVLMVVHEFSHGIIARVNDFEINSVGWMILGIIPGAFVEPKGENMLPRKNEDTEEALKKEKEDSGGMWDQGTWKQRLQVLTAGSFANYVTAVLFFLLATATVIGSTTIAESGYIGVQLQPVDKGLNYTAIEGYPAFESGMRNGTLYSINGTSIESYEDLQNISEGLKPNTTIVLETSEGVFTIETVANKYREFKPGVMPFSGVMQWFIDLLRMVAYLNFVVGFFNMLPAKPLDGGQVLDTFAERFRPEARSYINYWSLLVWVALLGALALGISVSVI